MFIHSVQTLTFYLMNKMSTNVTDRLVVESIQVFFIKGVT